MLIYVFNITTSDHIMKMFIFSFVFLFCSNSFADSTEETNFKLFKKVAATAVFKSHMLIYFPLPEPRNITLRVIDGELKDCDISGVISDSINYSELYSRLGDIEIEPIFMNVSYDLNIKNKNCFGKEAPFHGHGHLMFNAVPSSDRSPRYQTIKRKHKVIILFENNSVASR